MTVKKLSSQILFILISLIIIDLLISVFVSGFTYKPRSNPIADYLSYGFSIESKLIVLNGAGDDNASSIAKAGWINNEGLNKKEGDFCGPSVTFYGMSFTNRIADELKKLRQCIEINKLAGPGAPLNHSYASYQMNKDKDDSEFIVLGVLASSLPKLHTVSHFNSAFEFPSASMYPRYKIENGKLTEVSPLHSNLDSFRTALLIPESQKQLKLHLSKNDAFYDEFVFESSLIDYSNIGRMLRRSYAQKHKRNVTNRYFESGKFSNVDDTIDISRLLIRSFVEEVEVSGKKPVVLLLNDRGFAKSLDDIFLPAFEDMNITFLSSSALIDSEDLNNFEGDGHFTKSNDNLLARELLALINAHYGSE